MADVLGPTFTTVKGLAAKREQALKQANLIEEIKVDDVEVKASKTGNCGYRATTNKGNVVTWWDSTMEQVLMEVDENTLRIKPGVTITPDGSLIAPGKGGGFWS